MILPLPTLRSAPMRGGGSGSGGSPSRSLPISSAGSPNSPAGRHLRNPSRRRCREPASSFRVRSFHSRSGMTLSQRPDRSNSTTAMITASVIAVTTRRVVQLMPRPIHHNSAQLITMGTMILSCNGASASVANGVGDIYDRRRRYQACAAPALADELDAHRVAAAPDHFAVSSGSGVARKGQPQFGGQHIGIVDRDLRPGRGDILHHAWPRGEAAVERDPAGLSQRFAGFPLLGNSSHFRAAPQRPVDTPTGLMNRCEPGKSRLLALYPGRSTGPQKPDFRRLARPSKRHYTFARRRRDQFARVRAGHGAIAAPTR